MKTLRDVTKDVVETLAMIVPKGYVVALVVLPLDISKDTEIAIASIPTLEGGRDKVRKILAMAAKDTVPSGEAEYKIQSH